MTSAPAKLLAIAAIRAAMALDASILAMQPLGKSLEQAVSNASHFERLGMTLLLVFTVAEMVHLLCHVWHWFLRKLRQWRPKHSEASGTAPTKSGDAQEKDKATKVESKATKKGTGDSGKRTVRSNRNAPQGRKKPTRALPARA